MTPARAQRLLFTLGGDVRHAASAGLTRGETVALVLRACAAPDRFIGDQLRTAPYRVPGILEEARRKLIAWHRARAREALACCENRPLREPATFEDPSGEVKEVIPTQQAEDALLRIHPDLRPTASELTAPLVEALSVVLD